VTVRDRFGDHGLVGVMVAAIAEDALRVESLLLSCRVLGRGVEHRMLASLAGEALALGFPTLEVPYVRTERNQPAYAFLQEAQSYDGQVTTQEQESLFRLPASLMAELVFRPEAAAVEVASTKPVASPVVNGGARTEYDRIATVLNSPAAVLDAARRRARRDRPELAAGFVNPRTPLEAELADLWREALTVERVGINDDFFALGGDSLRGTVLVNRLQSRLGGDLSLGLLFEAPTVAKLAAQLDAEYANAAERLADRRGGPEAPSPVARMAPPESVNISALSDAEVEAMLERLLLEDAPLNG
jgi:aryl carrier-like protein